MTTGDNPAFAGRICAVGVGGGGCNALNGMIEGWENGPAIIAINTDAQALAGSAAPTRLQIGKKITKGMGAGGDVKLGRLAAEDDFDDICRLFGGMEMVFLVAALGGGTGTGAAPVLARAAHEAGALVIAFATLPFGFEGDQRLTQAARGLDDLREQADVVVAVSNERLFEMIDANSSAQAAFKRADYILSMGVLAIWKLLMHRGEMNLDFATLRQVARNSDGVAVFGYGEAHGPERAAEAVRGALNSPLLGRGEAVTEAESVLVSILGGPDMTLRDINTIMAAVRATVRKGAHVFMGTAFDAHWQDTVSVTLIASQYWAPEEEPVAEKPATEEAAAPSKPAPRKRRGKAQQTQLGLDSVGKGIFKDVEPTILDGQDLDIPTFFRRGVVIEK
jgi:cell division protein FtsZ